MDLEVWQRSIELSVEVYVRTRSLPDDEKFGLRSQMRRAAVSIASDVAEAEGRRTNRDKARFYQTARGSLFELQTQIAICRRLKYLTDTTADALKSTADRVGQLLNGTLRFLERTANGEKRTAG